jgi:hypothetical protein
MGQAHEQKLMSIGLAREYLLMGQARKHKLTGQA